MKQCCDCDFLSEDNEKYCSNCGVSLVNAIEVEVVFIIVEKVEGGFVQKGQAFASITELKRYHQNFLWEMEGCYIIRAKKRHIDGGILFHPIETFIIQEEGFTATVREPLQFRIIKPSN